MSSLFRKKGGNKKQLSVDVVLEQWLREGM
jgi:hypothetical protein